MKTIDLGYEAPDYGAMTANPEPAKEEKTKTHYPSLYLGDCSSDMLNIPDTGEATITYKVVSKSMRKGRDGEADTGCELEIMSITPKGSNKAIDSGGQSDAENAFDKFMGGSEEDGE